MYKRQLYAVYRLWRRTAYELETLAFLLTTIGFAIAAAYAPSTLYKELAAVVLGLVIFLVLSVALRSLPLAVHLRWPAAIAAGGLLVFTLLLGQRIFGAKNWIAVGPLTVQPSELVKLAFVLVGAATLDRLFYSLIDLFADYKTGKEIRLYKEQHLIGKIATERKSHK